MNFATSEQYIVYTGSSVIVNGRQASTTKHIYTRTDTLTYYKPRRKGRSIYRKFYKLNKFSFKKITKQGNPNHSGS